MTKERIQRLSTSLTLNDGAILCFLLGWFRRRPRNEFWRALEAAVALYHPELREEAQSDAPTN